MHRLYAISFTVAFLVCISPAHAEFTDVPQSHVYHDAITYVQTEGIVEGYPDGTYRPDATINRAEFAKILIAAKYSDTEINTCLDAIKSLFTDTPLDAWSTPYICVAFRNNIVSGYPDKSFRPANAISFAEVAKMVKVAFEVPWVSNNDECTSESRNWSGGGMNDGNNPYWWQDYLCPLEAVDALPPTYRRPEQLVTRGEMAEIIYRLKMKHESVVSVLPKDIPVVPGSSILASEKTEDIEGQHFRTDYYSNESVDAVKKFFNDQLSNEGWSEVKAFSGFHGWSESPSGWSDIFIKNPDNGAKLFIDVGDESAYQYWYDASPQEKRGTYYRLLYNPGM